MKNLEDDLREERERSAKNNARAAKRSKSVDKVFGPRRMRPRRGETVVDFEARCLAYKRELEDAARRIARVTLDPVEYDALVRLRDVEHPHVREMLAKVEASVEAYRTAGQAQADRIQRLTLEADRMRETIDRLLADAERMLMQLPGERARRVKIIEDREREQAEAAGR